MHGVQDKLKAVLAWRRRLLPPCSARYTPGPCALSLQAALSLASQGHVRPCSQPAKTKLYGAMVTMEEMTVQWLYKVGPSAVFERPEVQWCSMYVCAALRCSAQFNCTEAALGFSAELMAAQLATTLSGFTGNLFADQEEMVEDADSDRLASWEKTYLAPSGEASPNPTMVKGSVSVWTFHAART